MPRRIYLFIISIILINYLKMMYCLIICKLRSFPSEGVNGLHQDETRFFQTLHGIVSPHAAATVAYFVAAAIYTVAVLAT